MRFMCALQYIVVCYTRLVVEELRKTLIAVWQGGKTAISPESLFSVIWKVVPRFRYALSRCCDNMDVLVLSKKLMN